MVSLLQAGFLDEVEDEKIRNQVNILAFESKSSASVRRDALVFIMEQLEKFDDDDEDEDVGKNKNKKNSRVSDRRTAQRLDAIASWAAHTLTDGDVPIDKIEIHLVDHLVNSLRAIPPKHKDIVQNWPAITDDKIAMTSQGNAAGDRADIAKQRVLVQMLSCAAIAEVESVKARNFFSKTWTVTRLIYSRNKQQRRRYEVPYVFSLPQRKVDFIKLLKNLSEIYLLSTDEQILRNAARSMTLLSEGDHARLDDAKAGLKQLVSTIHARILKHALDQESNDNDSNSRRKSFRRRSCGPVANPADEDYLGNGEDPAEELMQIVIQCFISTS
eukprot:7253100-Ditylum_brightwellii.AAC.1